MNLWMQFTRSRIYWIDGALTIMIPISFTNILGILIIRNGTGKKDHSRLLILSKFLMKRWKSELWGHFLKACRALVCVVSGNGAFECCGGKSMVCCLKERLCLKNRRNWPGWSWSPWEARTDWPRTWFFALVWKFEFKYWDFFNNWALELGIYFFIFVSIRARPVESAFSLIPPGKFMALWFNSIIIPSSWCAVASAKATLRAEALLKGGYPRESWGRS